MVNQNPSVMLLKIITNPLFLLFLIFNFYSCDLLDDLEGSQLVDMKVNHYQNTGFGIVPQLVYLVQEGDAMGEENWSFFYDEIVGFDYKPGFVYELRLRKDEITNPPMDASRFVYTLINVKSRKKVPANETFEIKVKWAGTNFITNREDIMYLNNTYKIDCHSMCGEFMEQMEAMEEVNATFSHKGNGGLKLHSLR